MTDTRTWPTREKWEADERARAEHTIEHGINGWDYGANRPQWTDDERAEVEQLAPVVIAMIRRTIGRIERTLRREHPQAGLLARGIERPYTRDAFHRYNADVDALTDDERKALDTLGVLDDIRRCLRRNTTYLDDPDLFECPTDHGWQLDRRWPEQYDRPQSAELDRLRELNAQAVERSHAEHRERGRHILADLDSGAAWQRQLEHRARIEEWRRNGPVIHVIGPNQHKEIDQ
jgi:hypothetical protein